MLIKVDVFEMFDKRKLLSMAAGSIAVAFMYVLGFASTAEGQIGTRQEPSAQPLKAPDWQTAAGGKMSFEVASIRQSKPGTFTPPNFALDNNDTYDRPDPGGRLNADFPLSTYIQFAYKLWLTGEQMDSMLARLPKWVTIDNFEIRAKAEGKPTKNQMRLMMQSLLADRFKLAIHFETQQVAVLDLIPDKPGKTGPSLRPHSEGPPCESVAAPLANTPAEKSVVFPPVCNVFMAYSLANHDMLLGARNTTIKQLADTLSSVGNLGRPVVDHTGLSGSFDFTIEWARESNRPGQSGPDARLDSQAPTFLEALKDQLGLKLKSAKEPLNVLVIDHIERPSEN
jgi:uncharacterized protein (TIGR03435 family)